MDGKRSMMTPVTRANACPTTVVYGALILDIRFERAFLGERELPLQQSDWAILARLDAAGGAFVRSSDLLAEIWGDDMRDDTAFLRSWIRRLNERLGACCSPHPVIHTIPGGYRLCTPAEWGASCERIER